MNEIIINEALNGDVESIQTLESDEPIVGSNGFTDTYTTKQIAALLQVSASTAGRVMREIKSESDTLGISGIVHIQDYNYWLRVRLGKGTNYEKVKAMEKKLQKAQRRQTTYGKN